MTRDRGLRMTPQRHLIVEYLKDAGHHPTADEVLHAVNAQYPMTSRATVYNTLHWLQSAGLIREVFEAGQVRFDPNTEEHHHFVCRKCGRIEDVDIELVNGLGLNTDRYAVDEFVLTLRGVCADCQ